MGKEYFEFLEEEFQGLTSQVQEALKQSMKEKTTDSVVDIPLLFTRCHAIYQQLKAESQSKRRTDFRDRLTLYSIQLTALLEHYQNSQFEPESPQPREVREEMTFTFTIDDDTDNML